MKAGASWRDLGCAWELIAFDGETPPSWRLADRLTEAGVGAIIVSFFAAGAAGHGVNIVFWDWQPEPPNQVVVNDAERRLPVDDRSWR